jgi:hypothetical protein
MAHRAKIDFLVEEAYLGIMAANDDIPPSEGKEAHLLLIWERAIETQMHFAELSIKTRQVGMTVVGATLGLAIVLNRSDSGFMLTFSGINIPITSILCWTSALILGD